MPVYNGASTLVQAVMEAGAEVWLTTTRPYLRLDNIDPDTRVWLARHAIPYEGLLYDDGKYEALASRVDKQRVVAVLDDLPEEIEAAESVFGRGVPLLRRQRYNTWWWEAHANWYAQTLVDAERQITQRVEDWYAHE